MFSCKHIIKNIFFQQTRLAHTRKLWSPEESRKLLDLVAKYGTNWVTIQKEFPERSSKSLGSRYHFLLQKSSGDPKALLKKGVENVPQADFTLAEEKLLMELTRQKGNRWTEITKHFQNRSAPYLYHQYKRIKERIPYKNGPWTQAETRKLEALYYKHGSDFNTIAEEMKTRTPMQCSGRFTYLTSKRVDPSDLTAEQLQKFRDAVKKYGLSDIGLVIRKAVLPFGLEHDALLKHYKNEMDTNITKDWTENEIKVMVELMDELSSMELVQSRLSKKRSVKDMVIQYRRYKKNK